MAERVYIPHMLASYVRGKWRSEKECGFPMIMAKCCHDTDLMCWLNSSSRPLEVSSFGSRSVFVPSRKPKDATDRCLTCHHKEDCSYSCFYNLKNKDMDLIIFRNTFINKAWDEFNVEDKKKVLMESETLGRCAFDGPQDLVDHQTTMVKFDNGLNATLTMAGGTSFPCRTIHIVGTKGEIFGTFEESKINVRIYNEKEFNCSLKKINLGYVGEGHGGGDIRLIEDFVDYVRCGKKSLSLTSIEDSIDGHLVGIGANISAKNEKVVKISEDRKLELN